MPFMPYKYIYTIHVRLLKHDYSATLCWNQSLTTHILRLVYYDCRLTIYHNRSWRDYIYIYIYMISLHTQSCKHSVRCYPRETQPRDRHSASFPESVSLRAYGKSLSYDRHTVHTVSRYMVRAACMTNDFFFSSALHEYIWLIVIIMDACRRGEY
jgi:hypothetical protein